tara:strand:+ start:84 stop:920 length:837 start_codon:yes stop_codon:yes gene_type:complete
MKKSFLIGLLVLVSSMAFAQKSLNSYKYIIIPNQFEFQKSKDSYQINSLIKFLFEREGFSAFFENDQFPKDLALDRCLGLIVDLENISGLLTTKIQMKLRDCNNSIVFLSKEVKSKSKDYKKAYQEVIREAFKEVEDLNYNFNQTENLNNAIVKKDVIVNEIEEVEKVIVLKEEVAKPVVKLNEIERRAFKSIEYNLEGTYNIDNFGKSVISKNENEDEYSVVGGDEHFEFATIYKTSKPTIFIIKWAAFKQPQLVEIDTNGDLNIDTATGKKVYKRI